MPALWGMAYPSYPDGSLYKRFKNALHAQDALSIDFLVKTEQESLIELFMEPENHLMWFIVHFAYKQYDTENSDSVRAQAEQVLNALYPLFTDPELNDHAILTLIPCLGKPVHKWINTIRNP